MARTEAKMQQLPHSKLFPLKLRSERENQVQAHKHCQHNMLDLDSEPEILRTTTEYLR